MERIGYQPISNKDLVRFLRAYWILWNLQTTCGIGAVSLDIATYYAMGMGAALQALSVVGGRQKGRDTEDWSL